MVDVSSGVGAQHGGLLLHAFLGFDPRSRDQCARLVADPDAASCALCTVGAVFEDGFGQVTLAREQWRGTRTTCWALRPRVPVEPPRGGRGVSWAAADRWETTWAPAFVAARLVRDLMRLCFPDRAGVRACRRASGGSAPCSRGLVCAPDLLPLALSSVLAVPVTGAHVKAISLRGSRPWPPASTGWDSSIRSTPPCGRFSCRPFRVLDSNRFAGALLATTPRRESSPSVGWRDRSVRRQHRRALATHAASACSWRPPSGPTTSAPDRLLLHHGVRSSFG